MSGFRTFIFVFFFGPRMTAMSLSAVVDAGMNAQPNGHREGYTANHNSGLLLRGSIAWIRCFPWSICWQHTEDSEYFRIFSGLSIMQREKEQETKRKKKKKELGRRN